MNVREILLVFTSIGAIQSCFIGLYFLLKTSKHNLRAFWLGGLLLMMGIRVGKSTLYIFSEELPLLIINIGFAAQALVGAFLFLYLRSYFLSKKQRWYDALHFLVGFAILCFNPFLQLNSFWYKGGYAALLYHAIAYVGITGIVLYQHKAKLSPQEKRWLLSLWIGVSVLQIAYFSNYILGLTSYVLAPLLYSLVIYLISYLVLSQRVHAVTATITPTAPVKKSSPIVTEAKDKYKHLNITEEKAQDYKQRIEQVLITEKDFLNPDCNLPRIAEKTGIPHYAISYIFTEHLHSKFTDYINQYRIQEAQKLLIHPEHQHHKIASIAYDCGFNSLSAFNAAFKKFTKMTPSQYRKQFLS